VKILQQIKVVLPPLCRSGRKIFMAVLIGAALGLPLAGMTACTGGREEAMAGSDYGSFGSEMAIKLATQDPYRKAYSAGEKAAAEFIARQIKNLGYEYKEQQFTSNGKSGRNIIVSLPGRGFYRPQTAATDIAGAPDKTLTVGDFKRRIIVGAHYDTKLGEENKSEAPKFDGISDNASGVAVLLNVLRQIKGVTTGFDVDIVFFGASGDGFAGAKAYLASIGNEQRREIESVIVVDSIYGGDNLYANAGINSAAPDNRHRLRTPLYDLLNISVSNYTGLRLLDNQGGFKVKVQGLTNSVVYREFTFKESDHTPFDAAGLPVVYIESGNYKVKEVNNTLENRTQLFEPTGGAIRGTNYDDIDTLKENLPEGMLELRINSTTFILKTYIESGLYNAKMH